MHLSEQLTDGATAERAPRATRRLAPPDSSALAASEPSPPNAADVGGFVVPAWWNGHGHASAQVKRSLSGARQAAAGHPELTVSH